MINLCLKKINIAHILLAIYEYAITHAELQRIIVVHMYI